MDRSDISSGAGSGRDSIRRNKKYLRCTQGDPVVTPVPDDDICHPHGPDDSASVDGASATPCDAESHQEGEKFVQAVTTSYGRLSARSLGAGLVLGLATSLLNHAKVLGAVAAVVGSGVAWGAFGLAGALVLAKRYPSVGWPRQPGAVALFYLGACLTYYLTDWLFSIANTLGLREDVRSGRVPDPGPAVDLSVVPDLGEWLLWSALSIPAALLVSGIACVLTNRARTEGRARDKL